MLLDLASMRSKPIEVPKQLASLVGQTADGFLIRGHDAAGVEVFVAEHDDTVLVATRVDEILEYLAARNALPDINPSGISALLHHGLIPPPESELSGVMALTIGDRVRVSWPGDRLELAADWDYPWFAHKSREDRIADTRVLLDLLTKATADAVGNGDGFLMLSSGKDSVAVALALAEAGLTHIPCVTYRSSADDPEPAVAAEICGKLGLQHRVVQLTSNPEQIATTLTRFFERSPLPGADLAQIPYVLATAGAESAGGVVLDGGGNDSFMGFPVTGRWSLKTRLRVRGRWLSNALQRRLPIDSPLNYLTRSRIETGVSGRMIRFHESKQFLPSAVNTRRRWEDLDDETAHLSLFDAYAVMDRFITAPSSMKKHVLAAHGIDHEAAVPWCEMEVADYYFNLPEAERYNRKTGTNKLLLRTMLMDHLGYDADAVGKHHFSFDGARFVAENTAFIRSEIDACALWDRSGLELVHSWIDQIDKRPFLYHAILTVFMVSGWRNHSRYAALLNEEARGAADD